MSQAGGSPVEAVDRALLALQALADAGPRGLVLADLAASLGLNKTTTHRALAALKFRDFVIQDAVSGRYVLGPGATRLGESFYADENLPALLHPALVALVAEVDELVHLGVLAGTQVVYLDKVEPERAVRVWSAIGRRVPAATTALGRALLAYRGTDRPVLEGYVRSLPDPSPAVAERAWAALEEARAGGFARESEENEPGISCLAVPLLRLGAAVAAVSVTAPAERMTEDRVTALRGTISRVLPPLLPEGFTLPEPAR
jgi:DNA-binding IclR family transcriptional regulator